MFGRCLETGEFGSDWRLSLKESAQRARLLRERREESGVSRGARNGAEDAVNQPEPKSHLRAQPLRHHDLLRMVDRERNAMSQVVDRAFCRRVSVARCLDAAE